MNIVKEGDHVLYLWGDQINPNIEKQVMELKTIKNVTVRVENFERLSLASYPKSTFDVILSNLSNSGKGQNEVLLAQLINLVKPKGKFAFKDSASKEQIESNLKLSGFINIDMAENDIIICEKPNYDVGSSAKLSFAKQDNKSKISAIWKIDNDDEEEEMINPDDLLDAIDLEKPDISSLRVCGTTGKRKACKDCSCGLAEEIASETIAKTNPVPAQKSSCGSCYLGDAFRCGSCPYMGMPAFKPGEKIQLTDKLLKADV